MADGNGGGNSALAMLVGGLLVLVVVGFFAFGGRSLFGVGSGSDMHNFNVHITGPSKPG